MAVFSRSAVLEWEGDVLRGSGTVTAGTEAFAASASFPRLVGEPQGVTTPEELLAASHAVCFGIGLRSIIARRGGSARRVTVEATVTAEKGCPHHAVFGEALEGRNALQHPPGAGVAHRFHHHDVAQARRRGNRLALLLGSIALGRLIEEVAAVDVIRQERWRLQGHPGGAGHSRDLRQDLRARVPAPHHEHPLAVEGFGRSIVRGV